MRVGCLSFSCGGRGSGASPGRFWGAVTWDTAPATMQHPQGPLRGSPGNVRQGIPRGLGLRASDLPRASLTRVSRVSVPLAHPQGRCRARMLRDRGLQVGSQLPGQSEHHLGELAGVRAVLVTLSRGCCMHAQTSVLQTQNSESHTFARQTAQEQILKDMRVLPLSFCLSILLFPEGQKSP